MSTGTLAPPEVDIEIRLHEELENRTPCESGAAHEAGILGHRPEEPAAFWVIPGCGHDRMLCAAWVNTARASASPRFQCSLCAQYTDLGAMVYIPLDM